MTKGDRIKARREELGLTQTDLAEAISSTKQSIQRTMLWLLLSGLEARTSSLLWDGVYCMSKLMSQKRWEGGCSRWDIVLQLYGIDFGGGLFGSWFLPT